MKRTNDTIGAQQPSNLWKLRTVKIAVLSAFAGSLAFNPAWAAEEEKVVEGQEAQVSETAENNEASNKPEENQAQDSSLGSVTVTANRRKENAQKIATPITVLKGKDLLDQGVGRSAQEVFNYVPNATAVGQQHGRPRWWIRGIGAGQQQQDLASPIGFYLDEVYISNTNATGFPLFDLERVEVLRGPQGTKYGKNTTGGAVNIISQKPSLKEGKTDDYVKAEYGTFNDKIIQGGVNIPLVDDRLGARISFYNEDTDGRFRNQFKGTKDGGLQDGALRGQLLGKISDDFEALLNVHYRKYKTDGAITNTNSYRADGVLRANYRPSTDYDDVSTNADNWTDSSQTGANLNLKWNVGKYALTSITGFEGFKNEGLSDGDNSPLELSRSHTDSQSRQVSQEFRITSPREDQWNWLGGVHLFKETIDLASQNAKLPAGQVANSSPADSGTAVTYNETDLKHETTSFSLFGNTTYNWTDAFATSAGLSWSHEKKDYDLNRRGTSNTGVNGSFSNLAQWWNSFTPSGAGFTPAGTLGSGTFSTSDSATWNRWSYDFTPEYKITPTDRVFFKYAHGIKSGGFNTAATNLAAVNEVKPEQLDSYELGYKSEWLAGRLNFNATAFYYDYKDVQVNVVGFNVLAGQTVSYLQNVDSAKTYGLELEVQALPTNDWFINGSLGLLSTKYEDAEILNNGGNFDGNHLVRSPNVTANILSTYTFHVDNGAKVVVGGDARFLSKQYYYVTPQGVDDNGVYRSGLEQGAFTIVNARISYITAGNKYTVTAYANNLFDKHYLQHSTPSYSAGQGVFGDNIMQGSVRTVGVSFAAAF
ncbi:iron complex outermembrane recepter protein [Methylophilus rhizosphaerae]|uniref:Iron complex outermembrane recepter protein n=1 Tax=Methylophilus rhizosphaerae TaxID=492660 RepID=A0A1G8Z831_9PROT|nr:TonB-dependent receptor [Methylophilus rhizosphaerae]SDK10575.1 iron complex outermembrane recepter protein [Methylophilus rhizosphaerae]